MKKMLIVLTNQKSIIILVSTLFLLNVFLIISIFSPLLKDYIYSQYIYQPIVITALIEILILISAKYFRANPSTLQDEIEAQNKIHQILENDSSIVRINVISAGINTRAQFLRNILEKKKQIKIEIVASFNDANPDKLSRDFGKQSIEVLTHRLLPEQNDRIIIHQSHNTPSIRSIILSTKEGPRYAFTSWYTYYGSNSKIEGKRNLQFFVDWKSSLGIELLHFLNNQFNRLKQKEESFQLFPENLNTETINA